MQRFGKIYIQWIDNSLCETGFSFTRQQEQFTPSYYVLSQIACRIRHAPTSVYDDLATAQLQGKAFIGSYQQYCVQAINQIGCGSGGAYSSDPTLGCTTWQINWESSILGLVKGDSATGGAPVPDVIVTWQFLDYPEINGTGTTNADGKFVQMDGTFGLLLQVSINFSL
jgi:hypothetical protein